MIRRSPAAIRAGIKPPPAALRAGAGLLALGGGGGGGGPPAFGSYGPALPAVAGLTWRWDFDFNYEPLGAMRAAVPSRDGTDTGAFVHPNSGNLDIVAHTTGRRALRFASAQGSVAQIRRGFTAVDANDAEFTLVVVFHRLAGGADQVVWDCNNAFDSGAGVDSLWRYRLRLTSANTCLWVRANASNQSATGSLGTPNLNAVPGLGTRNIFVGRGSLGGDTISRGAMNGGAEQSSAARSVANADWDVMLLGAQGIWNSGTSGYQTFNQFADIDIERIALGSGSAADGDIDTLTNWAAGGYA